MPDQAKYGLIFYPGGLVDPKAYAPLMDALVNENVLCILLNPKTRLPMFEVGIADGMIEEFKGLVLLASYSNQDLRESGLKVL